VLVLLSDFGKYFAIASLSLMTKWGICSFKSLGVQSTRVHSSCTARPGGGWDQPEWRIQAHSSQAAQSSDWVKLLAAPQQSAEPAAGGDEHGQRKQHPLDQHWTITRTPLFLHTAPGHTRTPSHILHGLNHRSWRSRQGGAVPDQEDKASHQKQTKEEKGRQARTWSRRRRAGNQSIHHCIKNQQQ
jgi:hypothetical protein